MCSSDLAAFYAVIAWVFGGYIGATLIGLIGSARSNSRQRAAGRIGALAAFGLVAGILSVVMLRASFGVAVFDQQGTCDDLFRRADEAMYEAKAAGRNRVVFRAVEI